MVNIDTGAIKMFHNSKIGDIVRNSRSGSMGVLVGFRDKHDKVSVLLLDSPYQPRIAKWIDYNTWCIYQKEDVKRYTLQHPKAVIHFTGNNLTVSRVTLDQKYWHTTYLLAR